MTHRWTIYVCTICGKATDDTRDACRCPMSSADGVEVIPAKPVTMTPEQRFAAVDAGTLAISRKFILGVEGGALKWHPDVTPAALARTVLDALTEDLMMLAGEPSHRRLVSRWEPKACPTCGGEGLAIVKRGAVQEYCPDCCGSGIDGGTAA